MIRLNRPECPNPRALRTDYRHAANKDALRKACFDKCMYCESKISHTYYGDVEHIKPKDSFPELEFDWGNLGYACAKCNGSKSNKHDEELPFINPFEENPNEFIVAAGHFLFQKRGNPRAEMTIYEIGLNRPGLLERRMERMEAIANLVDKFERERNERLKSLIAQELKNAIADDQPYSLVARSLFEKLTD